MPTVSRHQGDDGHEWFEVDDERDTSVVQDPGEKTLAPSSTQGPAKLTEEGLRHALRQHFGDDAVAMNVLIDEARARFLNVLFGPVTEPDDSHEPATNDNRAPGRSSNASHNTARASTRDNRRGTRTH